MKNITLDIFVDSGKWVCQSKIVWREAKNNNTVFLWKTLSRTQLYCQHKYIYIYFYSSWVSLHDQKLPFPFLLAGSDFSQMWRVTTVSKTCTSFRMHTTRSPYKTEMKAENRSFTKEEAQRENDLNPEKHEMASGLDKLEHIYKQLRWFFKIRCQFTWFFGGFQCNVLIFLDFLFLQLEQDLGLNLFCVHSKKYTKM